VHLYDGDKPVCYWEGKASDFNNEEFGMKWYEFKVDRSVGKVSDDWKAGLFSMRLSIQPDSPDIMLKNQRVWQQEMRMQSKRLRVHIYQCESLPPADENGSTDPILRVWDPRGYTYETECQDDT
jgi:hypothetical protein